MSMPAKTMDMQRVESELLEAAKRLPGAGHQAVDAHRREAVACVAEIGLPSRRNEDWKYTDLAPMRAALGERMWQVSSPGLLDTACLEAAAFGTMSVYRLVLLDGRFCPDLSELPEDVQLRSLAELAEQEPGLALEALSMGERAPLFSGFGALNAAMAADGICLCVPDGCHVDRPIHVLHVSSAAGAVAHIRNAISLGRAAEATIIEHFTGQPGEAGLNNVMTVIRVGEAACLVHYRLQEEHGRQFHIGRTDVVQHKDSRYTSHVTTLGAALSRTDVLVRLAEPGAECELNGFYLLSERQHADHHTRVDHAAPFCTSREYYRGVLDGHARAVFNGKVVVHEGAEKTDAGQSNGNLLLSDEAEVDTKPELEIYADDVKCSHGATVGQLDADALFYLRSRGLAEAAARNMLTYAFADDVIRRMRLAPVREKLERVILERLPADGVKEAGV